MTRITGGVRGWMTAMVAGVAVALLAAPASAGSASAAQMAAATELVAQMGGTAQFDAMVTKLVPEMIQAMSKSVLDSPDIARIEARKPGFKNKAKTIIEEEVIALAKSVRDSNLAAMAAFYAERMSVEELNQAAAFYGSPAGKRMVALSPELAKAALEAGQKSLTPAAQQAMSARIQDRLNAALRN